MSLHLKLLLAHMQAACVWLECTWLTALQMFSLPALQAKRRLELIFLKEMSRSLVGTQGSCLRATRSSP